MTDAVISFFQYDHCIDLILVDAFSGTSVVEFHTDPLLTSATLTGTVSMFNVISAQSFPVTVNMIWTGYGDLIHEAGGGNFGNGPAHFEGTTRLARASGMVLENSTNLTPFPSVDDPLCPGCNRIGRSVVGFNTLVGR
jgi:hypothetical protein